MGNLSGILSQPLGGEQVTTPTASGITVSTVRDLASDPVTEELVIANGDLVLVAGTDSIAQDVRRAVKFFQGEFFGDQTVGTPYFQQILGVKNPNLAGIRQIISERILGRLGVTQVNSLTMNLSGTRELTITTEASTDLSPINVNTILPNPGGT